MTKKIIFWVTLVVALALGMTVVGCDNDPPEIDRPPPFDNRPSLNSLGVQLNNPYPVVGETITASYIYDAIGTPSWTWYKTFQDVHYLSSVTNKTSIGSGTTYTVEQTDKDYWIWAEVSYSGNQGTAAKRPQSTVIGIPATATVSVSMNAERGFSYDNSILHRVTVTLTLSDGKWYPNVDGSTGRQWVTMTGQPAVNTWSDANGGGYGRELVLIYRTRESTTLSISNLTATLKTELLSTMRNNTNVTGTLTVGTTTVSVSQWTTSSSLY